MRILNSYLILWRWLLSFMFNAAYLWIWLCLSLLDLVSVMWSFAINRVDARRALNSEWVASVCWLLVRIWQVCTGSPEMLTELDCGCRRWVGHQLLKHQECLCVTNLFHGRTFTDMRTLALLMEVISDEKTLNEFPNIFPSPQGSHFTWAAGWQYWSFAQWPQLKEEV